MRISYSRALRMLGAIDFELATQEDFERIMGVWRDATVAARNANNDLHAADLSQCKEVIKKRWELLKSRVCPRCKEAKSPGAEHCTACNRSSRRTGKNDVMDENPNDLYQVESNVYITPRSNGVRGSLLTDALRKLVNVGDSFLTNKTPTSVKNQAVIVGIKTICRKMNPGEKDKSKVRYRVWRVDALKASEVNQIIKQRVDATRRIDSAEPAPPPPAGDVDTDP